jgi:membrane protein DedA with SNARE-associated domain
LQTFLVHWGYLALFLITALSAFGIPVGSELAMAYGGALASGQVLNGPRDHFSLGLVIVVAVVGELVGSLLGYSLGRFGGRPFIDKVGRYILLTHRDLDRVEAFLTRRGDAFVLVGRLIPLLRSFVSIVAGLAEMTLWRFLAFSVIGCAIFTAALSSIGYSLGGSWHVAVKDFSDAGYVAAAVAVLTIAVTLAHRIKVLREEHPLREPVTNPDEIVLDPTAEARRLDEAE